MQMSVRSWLVLFFAPILFSYSLVSAGTVFIVVHGTWGADSSWHQPEGDFFRALEQSANARGAQVMSFQWNGRNKHSRRKKAALQLEKLITSYPIDTTINIVAHSHGTNVVNLVSQYLDEREENHHIINAVYAFGTPVDAGCYRPNMKIIKYFYHFFSLNDFVQPVLGMFDREYPGIERIANLRVLINGSEPTHSGLHSPLIAEWVPAIHFELSMKRQGNFYSFRFEEPGIINFEINGPPTYEIDHKRARLLEIDHARCMAIRSATMRGQLNRMSEAQARASLYCPAAAMMQQR